MSEGAAHLGMTYKGCIVVYREKAKIMEGAFCGYVLRFINASEGGEVTFIHPQNTFTLQVNVPQFNKNHARGNLDQKANQVCVLIDQVQGKLRDLYDHELIGDQEFNEGQEFLQQVTGDMRRNSNFFGKETATKLQHLQV